MISGTQQILLELIGARLFQRKPPRVREEDAFPAAKEALQQAVYLMVYADLEEKLPREQLPCLRGLYLSSLSASIQNAADHDALHKRMAGQRIPYVVIKGLASGAYYPEPVLRVSGDVDFLVRKKDIGRTERMLIEEGYTPGGNRKHLAHLAYQKKTEILEMHWEPNGLPEGAAGNLCRRYLSDIYATSRLYRTENVTCRVPDVFHHGLILLIHTAAHMLDTGIGLRHLCDWAVFAAGLGDREFCEIFEEKLKNVGLWHFARLLTETAVKFCTAGTAATPPVRPCSFRLSGIFGAWCCGRRRITGCGIILRPSMPCTAGR